VTDKMSHYPIMFIRGPRDEEWVRIYGLISTSDFMHEYEKVVQK
jgi:protein SCO1/2